MQQPERIEILLIINDEEEDNDSRIGVVTRRGINVNIENAMLEETGRCYIGGEEEHFRVVVVGEEEEEEDV